MVVKKHKSILANLIKLGVAHETGSPPEGGRKRSFAMYLFCPFDDDKADTASVNTARVPGR